ncbi:HD-GYP domain-containing protein [Pseudobutyrivibrio xylanivorans]|uniref:HD-GYP domain-containing protein n=1 Tax=Pseudobutyrivibrio xylanivorans TaxID=185007 RepID=UPI000B7E2B13|nr:HD-GYP domain-containing protein [Pseudobutyrivibrio xylanivorans]
MYLDTIGTIFVSILGGGLPGIITGMATNIIVNFFVSGYLYFSIINVLLALITSWFAHYSKLNRIIRVVAFILVSSAVCSVLGMEIQYLVEGLPMMVNLEEVSKLLYSGDGKGYFVSLTFVAFFLNIVDKGISLFIAIIAIKLIPESVKTNISNAGWKQKPMSLEDIRSYRKKVGRKTVLNKVSFILATTIIMLSIILVSISISFYYEDCKEEYTNEVYAVVESAASVIDGDQISEYVKWGKRATGYRDTEKILQMLLDNTQGVEKLSVFIAEKNGYMYIFQEAKPDVEILDNGKILPYMEQYTDLIQQFIDGEVVDELIYSEDKSVFSASYPIRNSNGDVVAYVIADVYMSFLSEYARDYLLKTFLCFSGFILLIMVMGFTHAGYNLVFPINSITQASSLFLASHGDQKALDENVRRTRALGIRTDDEIEALYIALCKMESEMAEYVRDLRHYAEVTKKMQNGLIITLAGMVENRDVSSSSHVQNTAAYVRIILNGLKRKGYYPEKISDEYMEQLEMSAPLHDIGKINLPDSIVSKHGELTDEEAEVMKNHTVYGREIIDRAIETVKGESYLKEARNMAAYHHERWDGTGYPEGLHGEVIPLSARIMALADYLDTLTSPRGFKISYSLEEALEMIQAESGKYFDPKCVEALNDSIVEVRAILNKNITRRY